MSAEGRRRTSLRASPPGALNAIAHPPLNSARPLLQLAGINRAQRLALRGVLARQRGDATGAAALHAEADALFAAELPPDHPLRLRNALDLTVAQWLAGGAGDRSALAAARASYAQIWPAGSAWKQLPDAQAGTPAVWQRMVL